MKTVILTVTLAAAAGAAVAPSREQAPADTAGTRLELLTWQRQGHVLADGHVGRPDAGHAREGAHPRRGARRRDPRRHRGAAAHGAPRAAIHGSPEGSPQPLRAFSTSARVIIIAIGSAGDSVKPWCR